MTPLNQPADNSNRPAVFPGLNPDLIGANEISAAAYAIVDSGMNRITCSLTGGAFATLDDSELLSVLAADFAVHFCDADRLVDLWELRHWTMCSRPAPAFRLATPHTIKSVLAATPDGECRLLAYMLTRLLDSIARPQYFTFERFQFLRAIHGAFAESGPRERQNVTVALDSFLRADALRSFADPATSGIATSMPWVIRFAHTAIAIEAAIVENGKDGVSFESIALLALEICDAAVEWNAKRSDESIASTNHGNRSVAYASFATASAAALCSATASEIWESKLAFRREQEAREAKRLSTPRIAASAGAAISTAEARNARLARAAKRKAQARGKVYVPSAEESAMWARDGKAAKPLTERQKRNAGIKQAIDSLDLAEFGFSLDAFAVDNSTGSTGSNGK